MMENTCLFTADLSNYCRSPEMENKDLFVPCVVFVGNKEDDL